jgi:hypothetical protein
MFNFLSDNILLLMRIERGGKQWRQEQLEKARRPSEGRIQ